MLNENIKRIRKAKGISQEELAAKLYVVRQTISKWEIGLSVPDSEMLIALSEALETPISSLLGESITEPETNDLNAIAHKLEAVNLRLVKMQEERRKRIRGIFIILALSIILITIVLLVLDSPYLKWNYDDPERAVLGVAFHSFEWVFGRLAPIALIIAIIGIILNGRHD